MGMNLAGHDVDLFNSGESSRFDLFGRRLRDGALKFATSRTMEDEINESLRGAREEPLVHSDGSNWIVATWSSSYENGGARMDWEVAIEEAADDRLDEVEMLGISARPEWLEIHTPSDRESEPSSVTAELLLNEQEHRAVADLQWRQIDRRDAEYFPLVLRRGDEEATFSARLGRVLWQRRDDGFLNHITLVSERGDGEEAMRGPRVVRAFEPRLQRTTEIATRTERVLDALITGLERSGALSSEAADEVRRAAESDFSTAQWDELRRVEDMEDFR